MPENILFEDGKTRPVATEQELLEFVNKIREAGGADVIDALFPSIKGDAETCLIARALNFSCSVNGPDDPIDWITQYPELINMRYGVHEEKQAVYKGTEDHLWIMTVQHGDYKNSIKKTTEIATKLEMPTIGSELYLPPEIGNAAHAFDTGVAFQDFARSYDDFEDELLGE